MKILVACLNVNGLGGSEMYHYELVRELKQAGIDVTLFTLRDIDPEDQVRKKLSEIGIKQVDILTVGKCGSFDIIVASQPQVNVYLLRTFPKVPIISIIHSEIRSEDPVIHPNVKHYVAIREPIRQLLLHEYRVEPGRVSVIYNPIDSSRYCNNGAAKLEKTTGIFIGGATDSIRFNAVSHLVEHCISSNWNLYIMSSHHQRYNFNNSNIQYIDPCWDNENLVKNMDFTAGILLGRTTLEGLHCNVPGYIYDIDTQGNIKDINIIYPDTPLVNLSDSRYVVQEHIKLYTRVLNENNL